MPALLKGGRKSRARTRKTKTKSRRPRSKSSRSKSSRSKSSRSKSSRSKSSRSKSSRRKRRVSRRTRKMRGGNGFAFTPGIVRGAGGSMLANPMPFSSYNSCGK